MKHQWNPTFAFFCVLLLFLGILTLGVNGEVGHRFLKDPSDLTIHEDEVGVFERWQAKGLNDPYSCSLNLWTPRPHHPLSRKTMNPYRREFIDMESGDSLRITAYNGKTLYVGGNGPGNYSSIRFAIDVASDGDTVFVYSGTYRIYGMGLNIDKSIHLIGENKDTTILDGTKRPLRRVDFCSAIITIWVDSVTVNGFTIQNSGYAPSDSGVEIRSSHNNISGNIFTTNYCGINFIGEPYYTAVYNTISENVFCENTMEALAVVGAHHTRISDNIFQDNGFIGSYLYRANDNFISGNSFFNDGIWPTEAYQNIFLNNTVNNKPLIYLEGESDIVITEDAGQVILVNCMNITVQNKNLSNTTFGLILDQTSHCLISGNTFHSRKWCGIYLEYSNNNTLSHNTIAEMCWGITSFVSHENALVSNTIMRATDTALYLVFSEQNNISQNTLQGNHVGLVLTGGSNDNTIMDNMFFEDGGIWVYGAWLNTFGNNSVNGKPFVYLEKEYDRLLEEEYGQVILVSCENITIRHQQTSRVYAGILVLDSVNCLLSNNTISSPGEYGIYLAYSGGINITRNTLSQAKHGIFLDNSEYNIMLYNTIRLNTETGIYLSYSDHNSILGNVLEENVKIIHPFLTSWGAALASILLSSSSYTAINKNNFLKNERGPLFVFSKSNNWNGNYWDGPRIFPKPIRGIMFFGVRWLAFDFHPAQEPNIIT